jgi:hypothetical protein
MDEAQEMIDQFEKEGYGVHLSRNGLVICWLWQGERIVCIGVERSEIKALRKVRKKVDTAEFIG